MKTLNDYNFSGKKAIVRVDFNVPLNEKFEITDETRIKAVIPTIEKILKDGGSAILMSHLGRPKNGPEDQSSLRHIVARLSEVFGTKVKFATDCIGDDAKSLSENLKDGEILLLENLRFYKEETAGDKDFAKKLADLDASIYVNDAFGRNFRSKYCTQA
jgi:phosphoglycerate kinase